MAPEKLMNFLPKVWSQQQCSECGMVFALPLGERLDAGEVEIILREELERHVQQLHMPNFLSDWKAEHHSQ